MIKSMVKVNIFIQMETNIQGNLKTMYFIGMVQSVHFSNEKITRGFLALPWDSQLGAVYSQYTLAVRKGEVLRIGVHAYQSGSATVYFAPRVGSS